MGIHVVSGNVGRKIDHAVLAAALHRDVVETVHGGRRACCVREQRLEQHSAVLAVVAGQHLVDARDHLVRGDVGQESETAAIDAEDRRAMLEHQAARVQHRAVATDRNRKIGGVAEFLLRNPGGIEYRLQTPQRRLASGAEPGSAWVRRRAGPCAGQTVRCV